MTGIDRYERILVVLIFGSFFAKMRPPLDRFFEHTPLVLYLYLTIYIIYKVIYIYIYINISTKESEKESKKRVKRDLITKNQYSPD